MPGACSHVSSFLHCIVDGALRQQNTDVSIVLLFFHFVLLFSVLKGSKTLQRSNVVTRFFMFFIMLCGVVCATKNNYCTKKLRGRMSTETETDDDLDRRFS